MRLRKGTWERVIVVILVVQGVTVAGSRQSAAGDPPPNEVTVMFQPGVVYLPSAEAPVSIGDDVIKSEAVLQVLTAFQPMSIERAFPSFQPTDTIGIARTGEVVRLYDYSRIYRISVPAGVSASALAESLEHSPDVVFAEPNGFAEVDGAIYPNDPLFANGTQWGHWNYGQSSGTVNADANVPEGWGIVKGSSSIPIAVIDHGIDRTHLDLAGRISGDEGVDSGDPDHGTRVAGIVGATTNNGLGIAGVVWDATVYSERIDHKDDDEVADAVRHVVGNGAVVLNNSWHLTPAGRNSTVVRLAFADAYKLNRIAVVAMGNTSDATTNRPAAFGLGIIAVGATDRADQRAGFSTTGNHIDLVGPGVDITSSVPTNSYSSADGTSFSTPYVSGIATLLLASNPSLYNDDVEQILRWSADDKGATNWDTQYGAGRVNARKALDLIRPPNSFFNQSSFVGGVIGDVTDWIPTTFYGAPGIPDGASWQAKRYEVHKTVTFLDPVPASQKPVIWGRGVATVGYSSENPNYGLGWCAPTSVSNGGYTISTYVYYVSSPLGINTWVPTDPAHVVFAETLLIVHRSADMTQSYFVPQAVVGGTPIDGSEAVERFRSCPNNDGGASLPNSARVKVVLRDSTGTGVEGIPASDIYMLFNGGTAVQGFVGEGADSILASSQYNNGVNGVALCPDVRFIPADGPTNAAGEAYITFTGAGGVRDPARKWGHYDSEIPVYVRGLKIAGRFTESDSNGSYVLRIKSLDWTGGLPTGPSEAVSGADYNGVWGTIGVHNTISYWKDFDSNGSVTASDANMVSVHVTHDCDTPNNP